MNIVFLKYITTNDMNELAKMYKK